MPSSLRIELALTRRPGLCGVPRMLIPHDPTNNHSVKIEFAGLPPFLWLDDCWLFLKVFITADGANVPRAAEHPQGPLCYATAEANLGHDLSHCPREDKPFLIVPREITSLILSHRALPIG